MRLPCGKRRRVMIRIPAFASMTLTGSARPLASSASRYPRRKDGARKILVIACGALAREVLALRLDHIDVTCLPAQLHNHPRAHPGGDAGEDPRQSLVL